MQMPEDRIDTVAFRTQVEAIRYARATLLNTDAAKVRARLTALAESDTTCCVN